MIGRCEPVAVSTMSASAMAARMCDQRTVRPPTCAASASACAAVRLVITTLGDALAAQVLRRQRADFAGADHEHASSFEAAENLSRERDRGEADRYGPFAERRLAADPLADAERPVERLAQERSGAVPFASRDLERILDLAQYLRLADDERIESRRHAKQMPRRRHVAMREQVRQEERRAGAGGSR